MPYLKTIYQSKETMKAILILIAVALGMIQTVARAAEEPAWSIEGRMLARTAAASIAIASSVDRLTTAYANSSRCAKLTTDDTVM
jgi:hypothetical protein